LIERLFYETIFAFQLLERIIFVYNKKPAFVAKRRINQKMAENQNKYSRRSIALFWLFMVIVVVGVLIYFEQIAFLYVLATLAIVALLVIVGFSDLENIGRGEGSGFAAKE
jgi:hypothetical protein